MQQYGKDQGVLVRHRRRPRFQLNWTFWVGVGAAGVAVAAVVTFAGSGPSHSPTKVVDAGAVAPAVPATQADLPSPTLEPSSAPPMESPTPSPVRTVTSAAPQPVHHNTPSVLPKHARPAEPVCDPDPDEVYQARADIQEALDERSQMPSDYGPGDKAVADYNVAAAKRELNDAFACTTGEDHHDLDVMEAQAFLTLARQHVRQATSQGDRMEAIADVNRWVRRLTELGS